MYSEKREVPHLKNDQELVNKIRRGDKEAFSLLVKDLMPSAYKTAYLILRSKEHAEDALQNALEGAYISIMKNKDMTNFKAWFFRIVYSLLLEGFGLSLTQASRYGKLEDYLIEEQIKSQRDFINENET
jgi:DNA-directed RNA polymerase specialized sigma24 family protein